jgi:hypothetical protein
MAVNSPTWSYGESKLLNSEGGTVTPRWSYGESALFHDAVIVLTIQDPVHEQIVDFITIAAGLAVPAPVRIYKAKDETYLCVAENESYLVTGKDGAFHYVAKSRN